MGRGKILFILHLPQPVHGAAMVGQYIKESPLINQSFHADFINLSTSSRLKHIGKKGLSKIVALIRLQLIVLRAVMFNRYSLCYMTLTASGPGFYKDLFILVILKIFRLKIIYHFHNKGISSNQNGRILNFLYAFVFKGARSILLSPFLYSDIKKYVTPQNVFYCPNGIAEIENISIRAVQSNTCRLLFLSNMMEEKGVRVLLQACKLLKKRGVDFECHFVGAWSDISETDFNNDVQKFGLEGKIYAHGKKYNNDKTVFFSKLGHISTPDFLS